MKWNGGRRKDWARCAKQPYPDRTQRSDWLAAIGWTAALAVVIALLLSGAVL